MAGVLDPCCGSRMMYFDKAHPAVTFCDNRSVTEVLCDGRVLEVDPDVVADATSLPFVDGQFNLVVFDPPHLDVGDGWQVKKYGKLPNDWRDWMTRAFSECWRVLAVGGTTPFMDMCLHICSECGKATIRHSADPPKFCCHCGAKVVR